MKTGGAMYDYGDCHVCGETMTERRVCQELWVKGKLVLIEGVPAGVCPQCGERVVKADVGRSITELVGSLRRLRKTRTISVPVVKFATKVA